MPAGYSMLSLISTLASLHNQDAGFPRGGSLEFARSMERHYLALGGKIHYRARVEQVLVDEGRAVGLMLEDGSKKYGEIIISAADLHSTMHGMLGGNFTTPQIAQSFDQLPTYSSVQVSLGVDRDLSREPHRLLLEIETPLVVGDQEHRSLHLLNYSFDPSLSPAGKTVVTATLFSAYEYWQALAENDSRYREEKEKLAARVIAELERRIPGTRDQIEAVDVATPLTYNRYTGVWKGAYMSWVVPPNGREI